MSDATQDRVRAVQVNWKPPRDLSAYKRERIARAMEHAAWEQYHGWYGKPEATRS